MSKLLSPGPQQTERGALPMVPHACGWNTEGSKKRLFGPRGFETIVTQVAELEKTLGIYDLGQFTAKM